MRPVFGAWFALNGCGEMTGTTWIEESGQLEGPVMLTNTHSVGTVHQATIAWRIRQGEAGRDRLLSGRRRWWPRPGTVPSTTSTAFTSRPSTSTRRSTARDDRARWRRATSAPAPAPCATTSSAASAPRRGWWKLLGEPYTVGVLVQANHGSERRDELRIAGVPVGRRTSAVNRVKAEPDPRPRKEQLDHHRGGHRRAAAAAPAETCGETGRARSRPHRFVRRQRIR